MKKEENVLSTTKIVVQALLNITFYGFAIFITITCANKAYDFAYQIYGDVAVAEAPGVTKKITIKDGDSIVHIANAMYEDKLIVNPYSFILKFKMAKMTMQPGKYTISNASHYDEIMNEICGITAEDSN